MSLAFRFALRILPASSDSNTDKQRSGCGAEVPSADVLLRSIETDVKINRVLTMRTRLFSTKDDAQKG